jgi:hypothetical protein
MDIAHLVSELESAKAKAPYNKPASREPQKNLPTNNRNKLKTFFELFLRKRNTYNQKKHNGESFVSDKCGN